MHTGMYGRPMSPVQHAENPTANPQRNDSVDSPNRRASLITHRVGSGEKIIRQSKQKDDSRAKLGRKRFRRFAAQGVFRDALECIVPINPNDEIRRTSRAPYQRSKKSLRIADTMTYLRCASHEWHYDPRVPMGTAVHMCFAYFKRDTASVMVFSRASRPYLSTSALFLTSLWVRHPAPLIQPPTQAIPSMKLPPRAA